MTTTVTFEDGYIEIELIGNKINLIINKNVLERTEVIGKDCGIPGVIGPDVNINLQESLDKILSEALEDATHSPFWQD